MYGRICMIIFLHGILLARDARCVLQVYSAMSSASSVMFICAWTRHGTVSWLTTNKLWTVFLSLSKPTCRVQCSCICTCTVKFCPLIRTEAPPPLFYFSPQTNPVNYIHVTCPSQPLLSISSSSKKNFYCIYLNGTCVRVCSCMLARTCSSKCPLYHTCICYNT